MTITDEILTAPPATGALRTVVVQRHLMEVPEYLDDAVAIVGQLGHLFIYHWSTWRLPAGHPDRHPAKVYTPGTWLEFEHRGPAFEIPTSYPVPTAADRQDARGEQPPDSFAELDPDRLDEEHGSINHKTPWSVAAAGPAKSEDPDDDRAYTSSPDAVAVQYSDESGDGGWRPSARAPRPTARKVLRGARKHGRELAARWPRKDASAPVSADYVPWSPGATLAAGMIGLFCVLAFFAVH